MNIILKIMFIYAFILIIAAIFACICAAKIAEEQQEYVEKLKNQYFNIYKKIDAKKKIIMIQRGLFQKDLPPKAEFNSNYLIQYNKYNAKIELLNELEEEIKNEMRKI